MKKIILTTLILMLLLALFSCVNNPSVDTAPGTDKPMQSEQETTPILSDDNTNTSADNNDEKTSQTIDDTRELIYSEYEKIEKLKSHMNKKSSYYSLLDGGDFLGNLPLPNKDFFGDLKLEASFDELDTSDTYYLNEIINFKYRHVDYESYKLITNYDELVSLVFDANNFDASIFDEYYVMYMYREYPVVQKGNIGFKGFKVIDEKLYIVFDDYGYNGESFSDMCDPKEYYLLIPKSEISDDVKKEGTIVILDNNVMLYQHQAIETPDNVNKELNTMWILKTNEELEDFCSFYGIEKPLHINFYDSNQMVAVLYTQRNTKYNEGEFGYYGFGDGNITFTYFTDGASDEEKSYVFDFIELPYSDLEETELLVNVKSDARILETIKPKEENMN